MEKERIKMEDFDKQEMIDFLNDRLLENIDECYCDGCDYDKQMEVADKVQEHTDTVVCIERYSAELEEHGLSCVTCRACDSNCDECDDNKLLNWKPKYSIQDFMRGYVG
jgi:hypothetical protein